MTGLLPWNYEDYTVCLKFCDGWLMYLFSLSFNIEYLLCANHCNREIHSL